MTRNLFQRSKAPPAPSAFQFTTPGGLALPTATLRRQLALVGGPLEVMHLTAHFMKQANEQQIPVILLGGPQDSAFLDLPDLLELNPVRTAALPRLLAGTSPEQLREVLTEATSSFRSLLGSGPQILFTGRHLGGHWPFVMGRLPAFAQQGGVVIADVRNQLSTPLPQVFNHFLVWPEGTERMNRAVERWQRHQSARPYRVEPEPEGSAALWSATG